MALAGDVVNPFVFDGGSISPRGALCRFKI